MARQKLAASLRAIARLLNLGGGNGSTSQRTDLELEIASRLSEANGYQEHAAFETLIPGSRGFKGLDLEAATAMVEKV